METNYSLYLTIRKAGKTIPYPAAERPDSRNYGFMDLKGRLERVNEIVEAQHNPGLRQALTRINAPETVFYTAGCDYSLNHEEDDTFWAKGYLDCVFSDRTQAQESHAYFNLFEAFDHHLREQSYKEPIDFHWELEQTEFTEAKSCGWTLCLWITTDVHTDQETCESHWDRACDLFCTFLEQWSPRT